MNVKQMLEYAVETEPASTWKEDFNVFAHQVSPRGLCKLVKISMSVAIERTSVLSDALILMAPTVVVKLLFR